MYILLFEVSSLEAVDDIPMICGHLLFLMFVMMKLEANISQQLTKVDVTIEATPHKW